tara:strand:- start:4299 stop:5021 length:723 start_codon:yes stop_codon:yes gene_type:complete
MQNIKKKKINKITIGLPCYNEEKNIEKSIKDCLIFINSNKIIHYEILIIDNNSTDNTLAKIEKFKKYKNIKIIKNNKNIFYSGSVGKIIYLSKYSEIGIIDTDGQYVFSDFKKLFLKLYDNNDIVFGLRKNRKDSIFRILVSKVFNSISNIILKSHLKDLNCGIKVLRKPKKFKKLKFKINHANPELFCIYSKRNANINEIEVSHRYRNQGKSIHNLLNLSLTFFEVTNYFIKLRKKYLI